MRIKVNLKIIVFIILFFFTNQIKIYGILMLFALIHELGHLIVGIILGFRPSSLSIKPVGISIDFYIDTKCYNKKICRGNILTLKKILIALAGPITNFIIVLICINSKFTIFYIEKEIIIYSNILIGMFNLIPIYPLDGGRIVKGILHIMIGIEKCYKYTYIISNVTVTLLTMLASFGILYLKNIAILVMILYLWGLVFIQNKYYKEKSKIYTIINLEQEKREEIKSSL